MVLGGCIGAVVIECSAAVQHVEGAVEELSAILPDSFAIDTAYAVCVRHNSAA